MAVISAEATLRATSGDRAVTPGAVTAALGVVPTTTERLGTRRRGYTSDHHSWCIDSGVVVAEDEQAIDSAVALVLRSLDGKDLELTKLPGWEWDVVVTAESDSWQGGFVLSPAVMGRLGQLGIHLIGTVVLAEDG